MKVKIEEAVKMLWDALADEGCLIDRIKSLEEKLDSYSRTIDEYENKIASQGETVSTVVVGLEIDIEQLQAENARLNDLYGNAVSERDREIARRKEDNNRFEGRIKTLEAALADERIRSHEFSTAYANERAKNYSAKVELER